MPATADAPVQVDPTDLEELDFEINCDAHGCERRADWWNVCLACGFHTPVCEPHRRKQVSYAECCGPHDLVICPECHVGVQGRAWRRLFSFVPIGGA